MNRFLKLFLRDRLNGRVHVAGFGKHPAWDDHIDDIGLTTETLVMAKQIVYSQGIAGQLASGAWDQIEGRGQSIEFDHRFVWVRKKQVLIGGIWASVDGKGRARFPMLICIQAEIDVLRAVDVYLPFLEKIGQRCREATNREMFQESLDQASADLNAFQVAGVESINYRNVPNGDSARISLVDLCGALKNGAAKNIRLPRVATHVTEDFDFWIGYLERYACLQIPYFVVTPVEEGPIDLIIGEPQPLDFFCLRAKETALPILRASGEIRLAGKCERFAKEYIKLIQSGSPRHLERKRPWWFGS
jgi:hypothetical protein